LSLISHEIKMPIATLQMNMEMLKMSSERPEKFEKVKDKIVGLSFNAVESIKRMLNDFIYFMSLDQSSNDKLSFDDIKSFVSDNWSIKLITNSSEGTEKKQYPTDKLTLKYILNTVVGNAEKYTNGTDQPVEIHLKDDSSEVLIEVRDFGIGMSKGQLAKMGSEQAKIDENQEITGMGFYLANDLSRRLGHELSITSKGTEGTSVFIKIKKG
ncbi:MAG: signal transduction histidine kinase, partial [Nonlabens sp.]